MLTLYLKGMRTNCFMKLMLSFCVLKDPDVGTRFRRLRKGLELINTVRPWERLVQ